MTNKIAIIRQTGALETKLAKLQTDINSIDAANNHCRQLIASHEQKIQAPYQSSFWRIAAPIPWFFLYLFGRQETW